MIDFYWHSTRLLPALSGTLLLLAGIILLHRSWIGRLRTGPLPGWALTAAGLLSWTLAGHPLITGPAGVVWMMLIALGWITLQGQWPSAAVRSSRPRAGGGSEATSNQTGAMGGEWRAALRRMLVAGPLAAVSAFAVSLAVAVRLPGQQADQGVAGLFLVTTLWAAALVWSCAAVRLSRPAVGLGLVTALAMLSLLTI